MTTLHKQSCPSCGQSVNEREIGLFKGMVTTLYDIWQWCEERNIHEFSRKDIKHLIKTDGQIARFGDWVYFGGLVYKVSKGHYGLNLERVRQFYAGDRQIATTVFKNPLNGELRYSKYRTVNDIPSLTGFLDDNHDFIARYAGRVEPLRQRKLILEGSDYGK